MPHADLVQMFVGHCSAHDGGLDLSLCPTSYLSQFPKPGSLESSLWGSRLALTLLLICVLAHTQCLFQASGLGWRCPCPGDPPEPGAALAVLGPGSAGPCRCRVPVPPSAANSAGARGPCPAAGGLLGRLKTPRKALMSLQRGESCPFNGESCCLLAELLPGLSTHPFHPPVSPRGGFFIPTSQLRKPRLRKASN